MGVSLPMKKSQSPKNFHDYCFVIYGAKGIGKTSLTAEFENSLNFQWEPWRRNIELYMVPAAGEGLLTWLSFNKYVQEILKQKRFTTLVMDTIDKAYEACLKFVCNKRGCKHPNDKNDYGATWTAIKDEFEQTFDLIRSLGYSIAFTSHEKEKPIGNNDDYMQACPSCSNSAFGYLKASTDAAFHYGYQKRERVLTLSGFEEKWTSCQITNHFLHKDTGESIVAIKMGTNPKEAYERLRLAFDNELKAEFCTGD